MQGYVGANSIFVYLIENIERQPSGLLGASFKYETGYDDESLHGVKGNNNVIDDTLAFHEARISNV